MPCPARGLGHGIAVSLRFDFNNWYNIEDCSNIFFNWYYSETGAVLRVPAAKDLKSTATIQRRTKVLTTNLF